MTDKKPLTHMAYAKKREGRVTFRWIEIGAARIESDGSGRHNVYVDRLPIGGFSGHIHLSPIGAKPEEMQPQHPGQTSDDVEL